MSVRPITASALLADPTRVADVPLEAVPAVLLEVAAFQSALAGRLAMTPGEEKSDDRLMPVKEAAQILGVSPDFLYRSEDAKSLRVRVGGRVLISHQRAQAFIARRAGRV